MLNKLILTLSIFSASAFAGTRYQDFDSWRSSDRTKTWTPPSNTQTLVGRTSTDTLTNKTLTSPVFTGMSDMSVPFFNSSAVLSQDNSNFFYNDSTGLLTLSNGNGASTTGLRVYSTTEKQIQIYDTAGSTNWSVGAASGNFYMEYGGGPFFIKAYAGIQLWGGSGVPRWAVVGSFTDNSTTVADIIPGGFAHDVPVFVAQNTNTTANNYSGWVTSAGTAGSMSTTQADTAILGIHESHTVGSETGHLEFYVQDSGAGLVKALNLAKDRTVTMPAYGVGVAMFNGSGVVSSLAGSSTNDVLTWNGSAWVSAAPGGGGSGDVPAQLSKTADYTVSTGDFSSGTKSLTITCNPSSNMTLTLPAASNSGYHLKVKNKGTASVTIARASSDTIDGDTSLILIPGVAPFPSAELEADGSTNWNVF